MEDAGENIFEVRLNCVAGISNRRTAFLVLSFLLSFFLLFYQIFQEVDVNGDNDLSWTEFTSYLVELANAFAHTISTDQIQSYELSTIPDTSKHFYPIETVKYFPALDRVICFERSNKVFKLYTPNLTLDKVVKGHQGQVLAGRSFPSPYDLAYS